MSLIEKALNRARGVPADGGESQRATRRLIRRTALAAVDATPPRVFTRVALDPGAIGSTPILSQLTDDHARRAYKVLRTRILKRMDAHGWYSLCVTSAAPAEGKSLTAINLAMALAEDTATSVFLVDLDLQRPAIARYLGLNTGPDLSNYLAGEATVEQIVYDVAGHGRLSVVPNRQPLHDSSELLRGAPMANLVNFLESESPRRVIIYDMPPALVGDDVMAFSDSVDCALLVVAEGKTNRVALENARGVLSDMNLIGVVLNHAVQGKDEAYAYY